MSTKLPYVTSPTSIKNALERIRTAATPPRFTTDFVSTVLQIKGGTGAAIVPFMKRLGLVASDGAPTDLYKRFRNQANGGIAMAVAIKGAYADLAAQNEYFYRLPDKELQGLILQVTGLDRENKVAQCIYSSLKVLKTFADFESFNDPHSTISAPSSVGDSENKAYITNQFAEPNRIQLGANGIGLNLSYTINLNLPATADQAVFNAIFKSLREHLLSGNE